MIEKTAHRPPEALAGILRDTTEAGFTMSSDDQTGELLRALAASRTHARLLELGTGTGFSAAWILDGMDADSTLDSVDNDVAVISIARRHLGRDTRLHLHEQDGAQFMADAELSCYDFVFADAWVGKYSHLDSAIRLLRTGGMYIIDDMLPQPSWSDGHSERASGLRDNLESRNDLKIVALNWSTGLILASKTA